MKELVDHLIAKEGFDIVIIDTPAVLEVSDSTALAGAVEAPVILVVEEDRTTRNDAAIAVQRFSVLSLPVLGVILNRAKNAVGAEYTGGQGNRPGTLSLNRGSDDTTLFVLSFRAGIVLFSWNTPNVNRLVSATRNQAHTVGTKC